MEAHYENSHRIAYVVVFMSCHLVSLTTYSQTVISGKVVGISAGDTITVLQDKEQFKGRLYGIDTPEKRQGFGSKAKRFTSSILYGKQVMVIQEDIDRYGRVVGMVYDGGTLRERRDR